MVLSDAVQLAALLFSANKIGQKDLLATNVM
jgi:hypothetical protein